ncbi:hypothetical protein HP532_18145 [Pseudomonas sp. CrR25]|nr:hypothetical protein [Pseudomonas sp. CrR25]
MRSTRTERRAWEAGDFIGGSLCLDFANTQGGRTKARDCERLADYPAAVNWAVAAQGLSVDEGERLGRLAETQPELARSHLDALQAFRESLQRLVAALAAGRSPEPADMALVRAQVCAAISMATLVRRERGISWAVELDAAGLAILLARTALSLQQLIDSEEMPQVRECQRCSWLFVDRSKNKRRRWCKTETCGNRARAARHYLLSKS